MLASAREGSAELTEQACTWERDGKIDRVACDTGIFPGSKAGSRWEFEADPVAEIPPAQIDRGSAAVGDFQPLVVRIAVGRTRDEWGRGKARV